MSNVSTLEGSLSEAPEPAPPVAESMYGLAIVWSGTEPERVGELIFASDAPAVFGRGGEEDDGDEARVVPARQRPSVCETCGPLENGFLSRRQLSVVADVDGVRVRSLGKRPLVVGEEEVTSAVVRPGELVEIRGLLLLLGVRRPKPWPAPAATIASFPFGLADENGIVGESPPVWLLREEIAFAAARNAHALVLGEIGTGKELVARAIHARSSRGNRALVSRNAATLPAGIIDAELFGNAPNYPNPGMADRPGLIGEADGSTVFLDEIGELPLELQTHLLRVLDEGGEYQRLGEARRRNSSFRLIAATNRSLDELKSDLAARLALRVTTPDLNARREDIPLIVRHLLRRTAASDPHLGQRFFARWDGRTGEPRLTLTLARALVAHPYTTHVRELSALLWRSLATSRGASLDLTDAVRRELGETAAPAAPATAELTGDVVRAALERAGGKQSKAWRDLGLANRHVLRRLMKKYGIGGAGAG
jgi:two-component system nitrogen regulation response regulator GlnG/two-component system response regulator HydG